MWHERNTDVCNVRKLLEQKDPHELHPEFRTAVPTSLTSAACSPELPRCVCWTGCLALPHHGLSLPIYSSFLSAPPHQAPRDPDATHSPLPNEARRCHPAASLAFPPHLNSLFGYVMESSLHTLQHTAPCPPAPHRPPRAQLWL